jgi:hypothetical protein
MKTRTIFILLVLSVSFQSCFKKDSAVPRHSRGNVKTDTIPMTQNYIYQIYFDLGSETKVSTNLKNESDLGFECSSTGWHIILNTSDFMKVADIGTVTLGQPYDTSHHIWKFDKSNGNPDSNAVGQWYTISHSDTISNNHVYIISRGLDANGNSLGFIQAIFDSLKNSTYYFRFAPLSGGKITSGSAVKDPAVHYLFFTFSNGGEIKKLEPPMNSYDLLFTQYSTLLFTSEGAAYPYLVTGVLLNRGLVTAAIDSVTNFSNITMVTAAKMNFSSALDVIGYDWKVFNFTAGVYTVRTGLNYVIKDREGIYYKLRFIGFNNASGTKGYPVFEYQGL